MEPLKCFIALFKRPFPDDLTLWKYTRIALAFSAFVTFFLYVFKPFGLDLLESNRFWMCLGFGSMTFVGAMLYELTIGQLLRITGLRKNWTFGKWTLNMQGTVLFISIANFIFARLVIIGSMDWSLFPTMLYSTFMIGVLPVTTLGAWLLSQQERKYAGIAKEINEHPAGTNLETGMVTLFNIPTHRIKYVEALQNYVKIAHLNPEGQLKIKTERVTLKGVLQQVKGSTITQCHRSYLVNKEAIISATGNAQGLLLSLSDCEKVIPVSRACVPEFRPV